MPTLSLCMIVKNEGRFIDGCLESVRGLVDEIVVVDTGSTDDTPSIAKNRGARVFEYAWHDDFADAMNFSIGHASGDWVLRLDADERLTPPSFPEVRHALVEGGFLCGMLRLLDVPRLETSWEEAVSSRGIAASATSIPRLLRRLPDLQYQGIIHECVGAWVRKHGNQVRFLNADIVHYGRTAEIVASKQKSNRNIELLRRRCELDQNDCSAHGYLAWELRQIGEVAEAERVANEGFARLREGKKAPQSSVIRLCVGRGLLQLSKGDGAGALESMALAELFDGKHPDFALIRGQVHESAAFDRAGEARAQELTKAHDAYREALSFRDARFAQTYLSGSNGFAARVRAGTVLLRLGKPTEAREFFEAARQQCPEDREAHLGSAECLIALGEYDAAFAMLTPVHNDCADEFVLLAWLAEAMGVVDEMAGFLDSLRKEAIDRYRARHRRDMHIDLLLASALYAGKPVPGPGPLGALTGWLAGARAAPSLTAYDITPRRISILVHNLGRLGRQRDCEMLASLNDCLAEGMAC